MNIMAEIGIICAVCLAGVAVEAVLPFAFPASVISKVLLIALLLSGWIKPVHIQRVSGFLVANMAFFFLPSCVGIIEHKDVLEKCADLLMEKEKINGAEFEALFVE